MTQPNCKELLESKLEEIDNLASLPTLMRDSAVSGLRSVVGKKWIVPGGEAEIERSIISLENIADTSFKDQFAIIYNQLCVLSVSILSSILEDYLVETISKHPECVDWNKVDLKLTGSTLADYQFDVSKNLGELILSQNNKFNFQDLKATLDAFANCSGKIIALDAITESHIIFYQQCRHLIVHRGAVVDEEFLKRTAVRNANISNLQLGDIVRLGRIDWENIRKSFSNFAAATITTPVSVPSPRHE